MILGAVMLVNGLFFADSIGVFLRLLPPSVLGVISCSAASSSPLARWTVLRTGETARSRS